MKEKVWLWGIIFSAIGMLCKVPHSLIGWVVIFVIVGAVSWVMADSLDKYINSKIDRAKSKEKRRSEK